MLAGINEKLFNGIKKDCNTYFWDNNRFVDKIGRLLRLSHEYYNERQEITEYIIKKQLFYHEKGKIIEMVSDLVRIEPVIMSLDEKLRDHIVHAILTFLLGIYIKNNLSNWKEIPKSNWDFPLQWKFSAPLHDIAYPLELFENLSKSWINATINVKKKIRDEAKNDPNGCQPDIKEYDIGGETSYEIILNNNELQNEKTAFDYFNIRLKEWKINIDSSNYVEWLYKNNISDHGAISSFVLLNVFDFIYQSHNPNRDKKEKIYNGRDFNQENFENDILSSTTAIFLHNIPTSYLKQNSIIIDYNKAPLAYLLCLSDKLQEWERYSKYRQVCTPDKFDVNIENNKINFLMDIPQERKNEIKDEINDSLTGLEIEIE